MLGVSVPPEFWVGVGEAVEVGVDDELPEGDEEAGGELVSLVPGLVGLGLVGLGLVGLGLVVPGLVGLGLVRLASVGFDEAGKFFATTSSTVFFGISGQAADLAVEWLLASAAWNSLNVLQPIKAKPVSAPIAAALRLSALTCVLPCRPDSLGVPTRAAGL